MTLSPNQELMVRLGRDRPLTHRFLFAHRHPNKTPDFHRTIIEDWHGPEQHFLDMVFRGGAKSTIAEEAILVKILFREFRNGLIVGESADRAQARLHAIRMELENNALINQIFGNLVGYPWGADQLVTSTGLTIQALGRGQSLRGIKFGDVRPDLLLADDIEGRPDMVSPEARRKVRDWFDFDLLPAMEPGYMARMLATPLHPEALPFHLTTGQTPWPVHKFPLYYFDPETGAKTATWPDRFPVTEDEARTLRHTTGNTKVQSIETIESGLVSRGQVSGFMAEYMCEAEAPESKAFKPEMFSTIVFPQVRSWQAAYSMTDPARTVGAKAATTGHVVWSWVKDKLVIWDAWGRELMPDEIIGELFKTDDEHHPVWMGFEEDGLNQWALQPIRKEMVRRGQPLPLCPVRAPPGKIDFIRGLQPFFHGREVQFARELPDLKAQLLGFPTGRIDVPNALAYALRMRPGAPIYSDFNGVRHVAQDIVPSRSRPLWLCLNATRSSLTGVVLQSFDGAIRVFGDVVREGDPAALLAGTVSDIQTDFGRTDLKLCAGPIHFDRYANVGLIAAAQRLPKEVRNTVAPERGRPVIVDMLQREQGGMPMLMISDEARWTLNAFAGGYSRVLLKQGQLADYAEDGPYKTLIEGLESFSGLLELGSTDDAGRSRLNAETPQGRPYRSMLAGDTTVRTTKGDWAGALRGD